MKQKDLEEIFNMALKKANERNHEYLTLESILEALLNDELVKHVIENCHGNYDQIVKDVEEFVNSPAKNSVLSDEDIELIAKTQKGIKEINYILQKLNLKYQPEVSLSLQRVIQNAALHVQSSGKDKIQGLNILVAIFSESESYAKYILEKNGANRLKIVEFISHDLDRPVTQNSEFGENTQKNEKGSHLKKYCTNLNELARKGKIDPLIGREEEIERVFQVLLRRKKNNPLIVGDSGVGKTALVEGLALLIELNHSPDKFSNSIIYRLEMAGLMAGTKFRGEFEERIKGVMADIIELKESGEDPILYIDEIHSIIGAGATGGGSLDASNLLKPALSNGDFRCIGSTTYGEFRKIFEKDQALNRRFQKIDLDEPSTFETEKILMGLKKHFEDFHQIQLSNEIIKAIVHLADVHIHDKKMPDKAIDVIDEIGAKIQLSEKNFPYTVTEEDVEKCISTIAKIPKKNVSMNEKDKLKDLEGDLKRLIFGQDHAIKKVVEAIFLSRSGLKEVNKPVASFLFAGPTGVGKTELAKQLANLLGIHFIRFDMSEYMEKHAVSKLIGAPPGYVGFETGGLLTEEVNKNPYSVVLLDEIEKAHGDIFNILLQVMDYGNLKDSNGRTTFFGNVILIMTTNAGAKEFESGNISLNKLESTVNIGKRDNAIKSYFSPEFRNRLSSIVHFNKLNEDQLLFIVDKFLYKIHEDLSSKKVEMEVTNELKKWLGNESYDSKLGARPVERFIEDKIKKKLAKEMLFGSLQSGGKVKISLKNGEVHFEFS